MSLAVRLFLDIVCWVGTTLALWFYNYPNAAAVVGATGTLYLAWAFRRYAEMLRINRLLREGDELDGQMYYFNLTKEEEEEFNKDPEGFMRDFVEREILGEGFDGNRWDVVVPEVEQNGTGGWTVTDVRIQTTVEIDDIEDDEAIVRALIDAGVAPDDAMPEDYNIDGDAYSVNIYDGWNGGAPLFQLIRRYKE